MPRVLPTLAAALLFVALSGAPEGLAARYVSPDIENKVALAMAGLCAGFGLMAAILAGPKRFASAMVAAWPIIAFVALAGASRYWSSAPADTLQSAIHLMLFAGAGICLAAFANLRDMLAGCALAILLLGFVSVLLIPVGGLMDEIHPGALRGPWGEKNEAGMVIAFGALCFLALSFLTRRFTWTIGIAALLPLLALTQSTTSLLAFIVGAAVMIALEFTKGHPGRLLFASWLAIVAVGAVGFVLMTNAGDLLEAAGKDTTLTGRSAIWPAVIDRISEHPWLGHGYDAFWIEQSVSKLWLWEEINFEAHNAHNGALETLLGLGIVGMALLGWLALRTLAIGIANGAQPNDARRFGLPIMLAFAIISVSESIISGPDGFIWFAFITLSIATAMNPASHQMPISSMRLYAGRSRTFSSQALVAGVPSRPNRASPFWIWKPIRQSAAENS